VEDALILWSVDKCLQKTTSAVFLGLNDTGEGRHREGFRDRRKIFFPEKPERTKALDKSWKEFGSTHGYIKLYWSIKQSGEEDEIDGYLEELLDYCQCLPDSSNSRVWHTEAGRVVFVTNPRYYQIEGIGKQRDKKRQEVRNAGAQQGKKKVMLGILELELGINERQARQVLGYEEKRKRLRSAKSKNKRAPPRAKCTYDETGSEKKDNSDGSPGGTTSSKDTSSS